MSYLSYITNHYQNARSDCANATKYIQHYRYNKSASRSETTETERLHKIIRKHSFLWGIQIPRTDNTILLSAHRHTAPTMTSLTTGNCSSTLCNIIIGSHVGRHCILLCELTLCSSLMIVFLWMRSKLILVIWIQNHRHDPSNREYLPLFQKKSYLS